MAVRGKPRLGFIILHSCVIAMNSGLMLADGVSLGRVTLVILGCVGLLIEIFVEESP